MISRKVKKGFTDRDSGASYSPGDLYAGTDERIAELEGKGYLNKTDVAEGGESGESGDATGGQHADARTTRKR